MRHLVLMSVAVLGFSYAASASTMCVSGTLASYEALGSAGCMIGNNTLSSFQTLAGLSGGTAIDPTTLTVTPLGGDTDPGIMVSGTVMASSGAVYEAIFNYSIAGDVYNGETSTVAGTSSGGNGVVTYIQNTCAGGTFGSDGVSGCTGTAGSGALIVGDGSQGSTLPGKSAVSVTDDFTLDSGGTGTASGGTFSDQYMASPATSGVPEPATYLMTAIGLAFAASRKAWFRRTNLKEGKD